MRRAGPARLSSKVLAKAIYAGTEVVEFSPTEELGRTVEAVTRNMEAAAS